MGRNWQVYFMALPALAVLIWFRYLPMGGLVIAFKKYNLMQGIWRSDWMDPWYKYFQDLVNTPKFWQVLLNTLIINFYRIVFQFPVPILFALMIDECRWLPYKRMVQTVSYLPHFLSWVIVYSLFANMLAFDTGIVNSILVLLGGRREVFLSDPGKFRGILVIADIWKTAGWGTIIILAAITAVDPAQHEAAIMDGAGKLRRIWYVTLPCIRPTIVALFIMRTGAALSTDVEMVLQFYNPLVYDVGDVLGTYMYRIGIGNMKFSFITAVGLFVAVVNMTFMLLADRGAKAMGEYGLW
jgi:putative aldouronate transport system permease protein